MAKYQVAFWCAQTYQYGQWITFLATHTNWTVFAHLVYCIGKLLLLLLLSIHLCSALSLQIPNALHALCQYLANRKHLSERLK